MSLHTKRTKTRSPDRVGEFVSLEKGVSEKSNPAAALKSRAWNGIVRCVPNGMDEKCSCCMLI